MIWSKDGNLLDTRKSQPKGNTCLPGSEVPYTTPSGPHEFTADPDSTPPANAPRGQARPSQSGRRGALAVRSRWPRTPPRGLDPPANGLPRPQRRRGPEGWGGAARPVRLPHTDPERSPRPGPRREETDPERGAGGAEKGSPARSSPGAAASSRRRRPCRAPARALPQPLHAAPRPPELPEAERAERERTSPGAAPLVPREAGGAGGSSRRASQSAAGPPRSGTRAGRRAWPAGPLSDGKGRGKKVTSGPSAVPCTAKVLTAAASAVNEESCFDGLVMLYPNSDSNNKYGGS
ncbi:unnamed protein product [Rangifer tarandus platyrhynchus]|uniref:Uncharacterized protein n=2 Tax=Rangifer tarandus platyrhynchus TaxID=3082113 RepID=A0ABN8ZDX5_RANTA|nr:unnamed protein product [Rangifer tarandus platyrhynchus]CAI9707902.1 unnamed protein product [Rangifer tarandus platyrhynchus]